MQRNQSFSSNTFVNVAEDHCVVTECGAIKSTPLIKHAARPIRKGEAHDHGREGQRETEPYSPSENWTHPGNCCHIADRAVQRKEGRVPETAPEIRTDRRHRSLGVEWMSAPQSVPEICDRDVVQDRHRQIEHGEAERQLLQQKEAGQRAMEELAAEKAPGAD